MGRLLLIILMGSIISFSVINLSLNRSMTDATETAMSNYKDVHARNIANSMHKMILSLLADSVSWRQTTEASKTFFGGTAYYQVKDTVVASDTVIKIAIRSVYQGVTRASNTYTKIEYGGWVPAVLRAAWTANGPLNNTISDMYIDGRDHDLNGNFVPGTGIKGVSTSVPFVNVDKGYIGGTADGVDYAPQFPENPAVIEQNYNWGGTFPTSPDQILGYPEGTLKSIAQSKVNGSQYVTDPDNLKYPLGGVTYVEMPLNAKKEDLQFAKTPNNWGVVVIHNSNTSSRIEKITGIYPFKGLLIGDYMFHFHTDILGGVILLSPNLETEKKCGGNRDHWVKYSSAAIKKATEFISGRVGYSGGSSIAGGNYGFAKQRLNVLYWYE